MKGLRIVAWIVIAIMSANMINVIVNSGMHHGVGFDTFLAGSSDPWQLFINNDLVSGLLFMVAWIIFRERGARTIDTVAWVWMVLWWGNIVVAVYALDAASRSGGDWHRFFLGRRAEGPPIAAPALPAAVRVLCGVGAVATIVYVILGVSAARFAPIATFGYVAGFVPVALSLALLAFPSRRAQAA